MELSDIAQAVLECMGASVYVRDLDKNIMYINPAAENLTGWSLDEARGRKCYEIFGDEDVTCRQVFPADRAMPNLLSYISDQANSRPLNGSSRRSGNRGIRMAEETGPDGILGDIGLDGEKTKTDAAEPVHFPHLDGPHGSLTWI